MMLRMHFEEREVYAKGGSELEEMWTWGQDTRYGREA